MGAMNLPPPTISLADKCEANGKNEKEQVRDLLEQLVNVLLGENVDDASVTKLYNDKLCKWKPRLVETILFNVYQFTIFHVLT